LLAQPREAEDRLHEMAVGEPRLIEFGNGVRRKQPAEGRQAQQLFTAGERGEHDQQARPAVVVAVPGGASHGALTQRSERVARGIEAASRRQGVWEMQQVAVLGGEQKDQAIDEAQKLAEELWQRQRADAQLLAQRGVVRMGEKAVAKAGERGLDSFAQLVAGSDAFLEPSLAPALERAICWRYVRDAEAARMYQLLRAIAELPSKDTPKAGDAAEAPTVSRDIAERRHVTVMFSDLVGSTALSARMDPEASARPRLLCRIGSTPPTARSGASRATARGCDSLATTPA
jgi:hypothetical protein